MIEVNRVITLLVTRFSSLLFTTLLLVSSNNMAMAKGTFEENVTTETNAQSGIEAKFNILRKDNGSEIEGLQVSLTNKNEDKDLSIMVFEKISDSIMISIVSQDGKKISNKPRRYSTEEHPKKKKIKLVKGQETQWDFLIADIIPTSEFRKHEKVHILLDIYVDIVDGNNLQPVALHLRNMNLETTWSDNSNNGSSSE